jgi:transmembrane sensor
MDKNLQKTSHDPDFSNMDTGEKILWRSEHLRLPESMSKEEAFKKLMGTINNTDSIPMKTEFRIPRIFYRYAATAVILIATGILFVSIYKPKADVIAQKGSHSDIILPDGSSVSLNADTKITYNKGSFSKKRTLKMNGEAFFNIEKGSPFTIKTDLAEIQILGTSFNIYSRDNSFKVTCFTGKIRVSSETGSVIILPGESASVENNKLTVKKDENIDASVKWRAGEFNYENTSLKLVFSEIERQFNVTFESQDIDGKFFTGSISNKNLADALDIVCLPMGLTYEIGGNSKVVIKHKKN